jgi:hypothetical protein
MKIKNPRPASPGDGEPGKEDSEHIPPLLLTIPKSRLTPMVINVQEEIAGMIGISKRTYFDFRSPETIRCTSPCGLLVPYRGASWITAGFLVACDPEHQAIIERYEGYGANISSPGARNRDKR